jgi:hypothetical protein
MFVAYDHSPKYSFSGIWFMLSNEKKLYQYKRDRDSWHHGNLLEWRLFLIFSGKLAVVLDFLTLQDKHNICTWSVNRYVHSVWINRNKIERITEYHYVIQCLLVQDAPFYILAFERCRTINKKLIIHNSKCFWFNFLCRITRLKLGSRIWRYHKIFITAVLISQQF